MVFQWYYNVANHWSNDGMVTIHHYGLMGGLGKSNAEAQVQVVALHLKGVDAAGKKGRLEDHLGRYASKANGVVSQLLGC